MAPAKKSSSNKPEKAHGKQKLFRCTGFGDCRMVFTRSEHLARHTRKHTGEKPFKCIVPGCLRMFSRFDNMMQHTQTHRTNDQRSNGKKTTTPPKKPLSQQQQRQHEYAAGGLMSPVSLGSPEQTHWEDESAMQDSRRLSVTDLCNPAKERIHLTQDEFEALEGFARFRGTPCFYESLRDLAAVACIEPRPTLL